MTEMVKMVIHSDGSKRGTEDPDGSGVQSVQSKAGTGDTGVQSLHVVHRRFQSPLNLFRFVLVHQRFVRNK